MGMESFSSNENSQEKQTHTEKLKIQDQIEEFRNVEQSAINEYNAILDEKSDSGDREARLDFAKRKEVMARGQIDQLTRSLRPNDWK